MANFLNAKDVSYDRPGSVAQYYGWSYENILPQAKSLLSGGEADHQSNMRKHVDGYLNRNYGLSYDQILSKPDNNKLSQLVNAVDYAYREEGRKQQTKGGGFLDFLKQFIGPAVGAVVLPGIGGALGASISAGVGGAIGGAIQGGVSDGLKGAALGGLQGYGVGSGVGWASGKLGLSPLTNVNAAVGGDYAARAAAGIPAGNAAAASGGLFSSGSNFLTGGT